MNSAKSRCRPLTDSKKKGQEGPRCRFQVSRGCLASPRRVDAQVGARGRAEERAAPGGRELSDQSSIPAQALQQDFNRLIFTTITYFIFPVHIHYSHTYFPTDYVCCLSSVLLPYFHNVGSGTYLFLQHCHLQTGFYLIAKTNNTAQWRCQR